MIRNNYVKYDKYGPSSGIYKDFFIDHQVKYLPHVEFTDECKAILYVIIRRYSYIPGEVIEATLFDSGYTELFEG